MKVRVTLPKAQYGNEVTANARQMSMWGGANVNEFKTPNLTSRKALTRVPRNEANLEAEGGETAMGDINKDGMAEFYKISGPRHSSGGVPLNLPENTFIFSDTRAMLIKDPDLLAYFGMPTKKGKKTYTPAEISNHISKKGNEYRKMLQDKNSDTLQVRTAEMMLKNINLKLGSLALAQESIKGFPQGIPVIAMPYLESKGIKPEMLLPQTQPGEENIQDAPTESYNQGPIQEEPEAQQMMAPDQQPVDPQMMQGVSPEMMMMYGGSYYNPVMEYGGVPYMREGGQSRSRVRISLPIFQNAGTTTGDPINTAFNSWNDNWTKYILKHERDAGSTGGKAATQGNKPYQSKYSDENWTGSNKTKMKEHIRQTVDELTKLGVDYNSLKPEMQVRLVDYKFNTGRSIEDLVLVASGNVDPSTMGGTVKDVPNFDYNSFLTNPNSFASIDDAKINGSYQTGKNLDAKPDEYVKNFKDNFVPRSLMWNNFDFKNNTPKTTETPREFYTENQQQYNYEPTFAKEAYTKKNQGTAFDKTLSEYTPATATPVTQTQPATNQPSTTPTQSATTQTSTTPTGSTTTAKTETTAVTASDDAGKKSNYPKEGDTGFDKTQLKVGDIYQTKDDKLRKVTSQPRQFTIDEKSNDFTKIFNNNKGFAQQYAAIEETFSDTDVKDAFVEQFKKGLDNNDYFGEKITEAQKNELRNLSPDEIVKQFLEFEKANLALQAHGYDVSVAGETGADINTKLKQIGITPPSGTSGIGQQLSYIAYRDLLKYRDDKDAPPALKEKLKPYSIQQAGNFNDKITGDKAGSISRADNVLANTTRGQLAGYDPGKYAEEEFTEPSTTTETETDQPTQTNQNIPGVPGFTPWWAQDEVLNLATFGNLYNINKQLPFVAPYEPPQMFASYIDPDRQIAAINESAGQAVQGLTSYSGPQAFSARMSDLQGNAAKSIADTLSSINNANQNIYNQANQINVGLIDAGRKAAADRATNIFDKTTVANQQFENAKNQARQQYTQAYTNALTNRGKTQALNVLNPQYQVDPSSGGFVLPTGVSKPFDGSQTASAEYDWDEIAKRKEKIKSQMGVDDNKAAQFAKEQYDREYNSKTQNTGVDPNYYTQYKGLFS